MFVSPAEKTYGQTMAIRVAIGLLAAGAILVLLLVVYSDSFQSAPMWAWVSVATIAGATAALWVAIGKTRLSIHPEGVRYKSMFSEKELLWRDVKETRYKITPINVGAHFGLIGMAIQSYMSHRGDKSAMVSQMLKLVGQDGTVIKVTSNTSNAKEAIAGILGKIVPPMVADIKKRIQNGETIEFGMISVSLAGVRWKSKEPVAFADISKAEIAGSSLKIGKQGKWLNYLSVGCHRVPNVIVLLETIKAMTPLQNIQVLDPLEHVRS